MTEEWVNDSDFGEVYYKPQEGENVVTFESEGETTEDEKYGKAILYTVNKGLKWYLRTNSIIRVLKAAKLKGEKLTGRKLCFNKTGVLKATEYSNIVLK